MALLSEMQEPDEASDVRYEGRRVRRPGRAGVCTVPYLLSNLEEEERGPVFWRLARTITNHVTVDPSRQMLRLRDNCLFR